MHGCAQVSPQRSTHSLERFAADSPWGAAQIPVIKLLSPRRMVTHASQDKHLVRQLVEGGLESASSSALAVFTSPTSPRGDGGEGDGSGGDGFKRHINTASSQPSRPPVGEVILILCRMH